MTLTEFLLARIAEDEAVARECKEWSDCFACPTHEAFDSARILAECEAKRRIVEHCGREVRQQELNPRRSSLDTSERFVLRHLASVYSGHPDYDEAWGA